MTNINRPKFSRMVKESMRFNYDSEGKLKTGIANDAMIKKYDKWVEDFFMKGKHAGKVAKRNADKLKKSDQGVSRPRANQEEE